MGLKRIYKSRNVTEAHMLRNLLAEEGIFARVLDEASATAWG